MSVRACDRASVPGSAGRPPGGRGGEGGEALPGGGFGGRLRAGGVPEAGRGEGGRAAAEPLRDLQTQRLGRAVNGMAWLLALMRLGPAAVFLAAGARKAAFMGSIHSRRPEVPDAHARLFSRLLGVPLDPVDFLRGVGLCELAGVAAVLLGIFADVAYVLLAMVAALASYSHYTQRDLQAAGFCGGLGMSCVLAVLVGRQPSGPDL